MAVPVGGATERTRGHRERSGAAARLEPHDAPAQPVRGVGRWPCLWAAPRSEPGGMVSAPPAQRTALRRVLRPAVARPTGSSRPVWLVLAGMCLVAWVVVGLDGGNFIAVPNLQNIAQRSVALGLVAVGQSLVVLVGLANGLVITVLRVNPFIATLGVALVLAGILNALWNNFAGAVPEEFQTLGY